MKISDDKDGWLDVELEEGDVPDSAMTHKLPVGRKSKEPLRGKVTIEVSEIAVEILGHHGRMISGSKSAYCDAHPNHTVLFNACLFAGDGREVWFGDIDLTLERGKLEALAERIGTLYLTPERPYRWHGFDPAEDAEGHGVVRFDPQRPRDG